MIWRFGLRKKRHFPPFLRGRRAGALARLCRSKLRLESRLRRFVRRRTGWGLHRGFKLWGPKWRKVAQTSADFAIRDRSRGVTGRDQSIERREHGGTKPSGQVATFGRAGPHDLSGEDGTAIELFIAGVQGWDTGLRRVLATSADEK